MNMWKWVDEIDDPLNMKGITYSNYNTSSYTRWDVKSFFRMKNVERISLYPRVRLITDRELKMPSITQTMKVLCDVSLKDKNIRYRKGFWKNLKSPN